MKHYGKERITQGLWVQIGVDGDRGEESCDAETGFDPWREEVFLR